MIAVRLPWLIASTGLDPARSTNCSTTSPSILASASRSSQGLGDLVVGELLFWWYRSVLLL